MNGVTKKISILLLILMLQIIPAHITLAQEPEKESTEKVPVMTEKEEKNEILLIQIRKHLQNARTDYFQIGNNIDSAKEKLMQVTETITTLKDQVANLEYLINNTQAKIRNVEKQIAQRQNLLEVLDEEIKIKQIELENQKILLKEYLKLLYIQENSFYDRNGDEDIAATKLLLGESSVGETFQEIQYFTILEQTGQNIFSNIEELKSTLEDREKAVEETKLKLTRLNIQLEEEKKNLQIQRNAKEKLLEQTKGEEEIYRQLIAESKREQLALVAEINALKDGLALIEQKILEEGDDFNPDNYSHLISPNVRAIYDFELSGEYATGEKLNWPVTPSRGISAYFRDSSYKSTFGIPHNAIDIPVAQGTPVRAPSSGVVYKVKDNNDTSYSYIILAHKGGVLTVFGHMSETLVEERDVVLPGEMIGLSGGIPGTTGAGYLTTGAHLHFEVIKSGKHVDPLFLLPIEQLDPDYIPSYMIDLLPEDLKAEIEAEKAAEEEEVEDSEESE
ncbi:murein hydrolase activator EnvC family protein [Patescibacteria group bacterium]